MPRAWANAARQPPVDDGEKPLTVLVTGFGPFLSKFPKNSSWEIASTLPAVLPATPEHPTPVHIYVHHQAIRVAYNHVVNLVPKLHPPRSQLYPKPDIVLHIGLAAGRTFYTLEQGAHGRGFGAIPDVDGDRFPDDLADSKFPRNIFPPVLHTGFDTADSLKKWKTNLGYKDPSADAETAKRPDVRLSPDAGNFMCGFIYYNSLAHYFHEMEERGRPIAFLHVPDLSDSDEKLNTGRTVTIELIRALVATFRERGAKHNVAKAVRPDGEHIRADTDINFV